MINYSISRQDSPYGHMKWHVVGIFPNGSKISEWFKTRKEAEYYVEFHTSEFYLKKMELM